MSKVSVNSESDFWTSSWILCYIWVDFCSEYPCLAHSCNLDSFVWLIWLMASCTVMPFYYSTSWWKLERLCLSIFSNLMETYWEQTCSSFSLFYSFFSFSHFSLAGRIFCFFVMRFWLLKTYNGPDDPEATKIFKVAQDGHPQKKIVTAVYEWVCHNQACISAVKCVW